MKKIFFSIFYFFVLTINVFANIKDQIIPTDDTAISDNNAYVDGGETVFIVKYFRDSIFTLLYTITIIIFLFIGARLIVARGNPEEFKKALMHFIYAIIGLFVVAISWAAVKIITGLDF